MGTLSQAALDKFDARLIAPFGTIGINADDQAVTSVVFLGPDVSAKAPTKNTLAHLACVQLMSYLNNPKFVFDLPVRLTGSKHQLDVWHAMQQITAGNTITYGVLAEGIGSNARAVGTACGKNPVPIVVPCHRIVAASGLGGFMGGKREDPLATKRWLLTHEGAAAVSTISGKSAGKLAGTPSLF
jgi:methylated-DNA-[protein]-cysteine S-methyltransferase